MPVYRIKNISTTTQLGIWEITESTNELIKSLKKKGFDTSNIPTTRNKQRIKQWLATRLLCFHFFEDFTIHYDESGKPHLTNNQFISISHSRQFVVVMINEETTCGVDIEILSPKVDRIKHKFLSSSEIEMAKSNETLLIFWGAKEALYKMYGKKQIIFNEQLFLSKFDAEKNHFSGEIKTETAHHTVDLVYEKIEDFILVYTL